MEKNAGITVELLRQEDTCWVVTLGGERDVDGTLEIRDTRGRRVGGFTLPPAEQGCPRRWAEGVVRCARHPDSWLPRRPRLVQAVGGGVSAGALVAALREAGMPGMPGEAPVRYRCCAGCGRRAQTPLLSLCPTCAAMFHCSAACRREDACHARWCARLPGYLAGAAGLRDAHLPVTAALRDAHLPVTEGEGDAEAEEGLGEAEYRAYLQREGVLHHGYWRRELPAPGLPRFGRLPHHQHPWGLPEEGDVLEGPPAAGPGGALGGWGEYYAWRGLPVRSPVCILLQGPLTVYHVLRAYCPALLADTPALHVLLLGAEREADLAPVYGELAHLLPQHQVALSLVGPALSRKVHGRELLRTDRLVVTAYRGFYHQVELPPAHVAVGLNAGLAAYPSWLPTLRALRAAGTPTFFTDHCRLSCALAEDVVTRARLGVVPRVTVNPFRSPVRRRCEEHVLPWHSNGYIYQVAYTEEQEEGEETEEGRVREVGEENEEGKEREEGEREEETGMGVECVR